MFATSLASAAMSAETARLQFSGLAANSADTTTLQVNIGIAINVLLRVNVSARPFNLRKALRLVHSSSSATP